MVVSLLAHRRLCYVERKNSLSALWKTKVSSALLNKSTAVYLFFTITSQLNNSSRENKENHYCNRGLDMCS